MRARVYSSDPRRIGAGPVTIQRPKGFFDEEGDMPASVEFERRRPPRLLGTEQ